MSDELPADELTLRCPTCGAQQPLAEACRRCRTDLSLVEPLVRYRGELRRRCLLHLEAGRFHVALRAARQCCNLSRDKENLRLLAVAHLLAGNLDAALAIIQPRTGAR